MEKALPCEGQKEKWKATWKRDWATWKQRKIFPFFLCHSEKYRKEWWNFLFFFLCLTALVPSTDDKEREREYDIAGNYCFLGKHFFCSIKINKIKNVSWQLALYVWEFPHVCISYPVLYEKNDIYPWQPRTCLILFLPLQDLCLELMLQCLHLYHLFGLLNSRKII